MEIKKVLSMDDDAENIEDIVIATSLQRIADELENIIEVIMRRQTE